jgi:hypothetical protein
MVISQSTHARLIYLGRRELTTTSISTKLDWTGRQIRKDKRGAMPADLEPLLERIGISTELWVDCVVNFRKWFRSNVGRPKAMETAAAARGQNRAISIVAARRAFITG